jgi:DNA polymerase-3 subunit delta
MEAEQILMEWKKGVFSPIYWLEGEEKYYIDKITEYAENHILSAEDASFNLSILYGKDSKIEEVINTSKRYPMFAERQVVILKEAQQIRDIEKLEHYVDHPLVSTVLIVAYKDKNVDKRKSFGKLLHKKVKVLTTKKLYDNELPMWTSNLIRDKGLEIKPKALQLIVDHIGNDLQRIENEIDKLNINLNGKKLITEDDIENYIGISKEFNIFELQAALVNKDLLKCLTIVNYFASNPKAVPIQLIMPTLYSFFSKLYVVAHGKVRDEYAVASALGTNTFFAKQYVTALQRYNAADVENVLLLLHHYNLKSLGINKSDIEDAELMRELIVKIII